MITMKTLHNPCLPILPNASIDLQLTLGAFYLSLTSQKPLITTRKQALLNMKLLLMDAHTAASINIKSDTLLPNMSPSEMVPRLNTLLPSIRPSEKANLLTVVAMEVLQVKT